MTDSTLLFTLPRLATGRAVLVVVAAMLMLFASVETQAQVLNQKPVEQLAAVNIDKPTTAQDWLARAEKKHLGIKTLTADIDWLRIQGLVGDEQRRLGTLKVDLAKPAKFAVHFTELKFSRRTKKQDRWYIFDGKWLVEKLIDKENEKKQFFKWQVVPPNAKPEQANPLALGRGPFAVPVPVNRQVINDRFAVEVIKGKKGDDDKLVGLRLKPKRQFKEHVRFVSMDIWYDRETMIPAKVHSVDDSENESIFKLIDVKAGVNVDKKAFSTAEPRAGEGWDVVVTPFGK